MLFFEINPLGNLLNADDLLESLLNALKGFFKYLVIRNGCVIMCKLNKKPFQSYLFEIIP